MRIDLFEDASPASPTSPTSPASPDVSPSPASNDKHLQQNDAGDAITNLVIKDTWVSPIRVYGDALCVTRVTDHDFWSICRRIDATELEAELLGWGQGRGHETAVQKIADASDRGYIDRCFGFLARRRTEAEPCWPWLADHRHGADFRRLRTIAGLPEPTEPPEAQLPEPGYANLPLDQLDRRVLEAIAAGEVTVLRKEDAPPCRCAK